MIRFYTCFVFTLLFFKSFSQSENTWLWEIKKKGIKHSSYLFGTFHEAGNSIFDSFKTSKKALLASKELLIESLDTTMNFRISQEDVNRGALIWMSLLNKDQQKVFLSYIVKYNLAYYLAIPGPEIVLNLHHDYISQFCSKYSNDTLFAMDYQIELIARKNKIVVKALDDMIKYNEIRLGNTTDSINKTDSSVINEMISIMSDILNLKKDQVPCKVLEDYINTQTNYSFDLKSNFELFSMSIRNEKWINIIETELKGNSCFIAVGFNHLRFSDGLIMQLKKRGFKLLPISMN